MADGPGGENHPTGIIQFICNFCGRKIRVPTSYAGKKGKCPQCKNVVIIPKSTPSQQSDDPIQLIHDYTPPAIAQRTFEPSDNYTAKSSQKLDHSDYYSDQPSQKTVQPPEPNPPVLVHMLTFPFSLSGAIHFLIFWLVPYLVVFLQITIFQICCYGQLLALAAYVFLMGYFFYYIAICIVAAAKDERFVPDLSFIDPPSAGDLVRRVLLVFGTTLIGFGPLAVYAIYFYLWPGNTALLLDPIIWLLYGFGVFLFPMLLLAVSMFDSAAALNPFLIIASILSTFVPYCRLLMVLAVIAALMAVVPFLQPAWAIIGWGVNIYLMILAAFALGRFFRRYEKRLNWEIKL